MTPLNRAEEIAHLLLEHDAETCPSQQETAEVIFALIAENRDAASESERLKREIAQLILSMHARGETESRDSLQGIADLTIAEAKALREMVA